MKKFTVVLAIEGNTNEEEVAENVTSFIKLISNNLSGNGNNVECFLVQVINETAEDEKVKKQINDFIRGYTEPISIDFGYGQK